MRAIALAIALGTAGIEAAILGKEIPDSAGYALGIAFFVCLIFGW